MTKQEAKELLRRRYKKLGYEVQKIRFSGDGIIVTFGHDEEGKGRGPKGLPSIRCGWPENDPGAQQQLSFTKTRRQKVRRSVL